MGISVHEEAEKAPTPLSPEQLIQRFGRLNVLDDLVRLRAADAIQEPILAYPTSENDPASYEYFSGLDLDSMINHAAYTLMEYGFRPPRDDGAVVALFTQSDLNMVITFFALSRLGYTVMMLSPRLSAAACISLLDVVGCDTILYGQTSSIRVTMGEILLSRLVACRPIIQRPSFDTVQQPAAASLNRNPNTESLTNKTALILHSSGSTGAPKPLFLSHKALMTHPLRGPGLSSFNSLPWFHLHGLSTAFQAMWMRKTAFMWNVSVPITAGTLIAALESARPESIHAVAYTLQLLVDSSRGIDALRQAKVVTFGGAPCPDELGDRLVREGVSFGGSFGMTEAGLVAESISRPKDDPYWSYMRFFDNIRPFIWMKPIGDSLYECVYLSGHPALTASNSNEPPGSFHSKDVFTPHPTIPERWKYVTRVDDRINLVNGEKVLPLPIEGSIKQDPLVQEAVVVGVNKAVPGLLLFRAEEAKKLSDTEYLNYIWPSIDDANSRAEHFSQIARDMVVVLPHTAVCPRTDKGSMIRAQVYQKYSDVIDSIYNKGEESGDGAMELDTAATQEHLMRLCREELGISISGPTAEFFAEGFDSLKAIHMRRLILRDFRIDDSKSVSQNIVFDAGSASRLAEFIQALQNGQGPKVEDEVSLMPGLIEKYSNFRLHKPVAKSKTTKKSVILTGATGSIGAHTLIKLLNDRTISTVYCLTRRAQPKEAIMKALSQKSLSVMPFRSRKIVALAGSLDQPDFGVDPGMLNEMRQSVSLIIHTAWPVNFNLPLSSFEPHIKGLYNLIDFSLSVKLPQPATVMFCSSISTALGAKSSEVAETPLEDLDCALDMGYGRSKLIGERIVSNARRSGARTFSLRIGQVSGHSKKGLWNDSEAIPLMIRSALTLKALPEIDTTCSWLPVDKLASSILELSKACSHQDLVDGRSAGYVDDSIYNLCNSREFTWSAMLKTLRKSGFTFTTVPFETWLQMLRESEARGEEQVNPAVKLADHYEEMYSETSSLGSQKQKMKKFTTEKAERDSTSLRNGRLRIIEDGILGRYARDWLKRW
ncbi:hypothetical protein MW887_004109 [Aspergillus wentii]|nr:hypothetical protein MW887_004109 [Aspergillus wentii]